MGEHGRGNVPITSEVTVYTRATAAREESEVPLCTHHAFDTSPPSAVYPALGEMAMQKDADAADADAAQMQSSRRRPGSGPSMRAAIMGHGLMGCGGMAPAFHYWCGVARREGSKSPLAERHVLPTRAHPTRVSHHREQGSESLILSDSR